MRDYPLKLLPPPTVPAVPVLRAQTLPCEGRWWWSDAATTPVVCLEERVTCDVTLRSEFEEGIWIRGFFVYDVTGDDGVLTYETSISSNVIQNGCTQEAPPVPVPEPGFADAMFWTLVFCVAMGWLAVRLK